MIRKNCKNCGKFTWKWPKDINKGKNSFCCFDCYTDYKNNKGVLNIKCDGCGKKFDKFRSAYNASEKHYCSKECQYKGGRKNIECENCGDEFEIYRYRLRKSDSHYCSLDCRNQAYKIYPKTIEIRNKINSRNRARRNISNLHDEYIKGLIYKSSGLRSDNIPKKLVELKRLNVKRKRIILNQKQK